MWARMIFVTQMIIEIMSRIRQRIVQHEKREINVSFRVIIGGDKHFLFYKIHTSYLFLYFRRFKDLSCWRILGDENVSLPNPIKKKKSGGKCIITRLIVEI